MIRGFLLPAAVGALAAMTLALPAFGALQPGAEAPTFTVKASLGGEEFTFSLQKALAKGPVVLYFFPAAYTKGCDIEAHTFSTHKAQFVKAGATIIGISRDSIAKLNKFSSDPDFCAGKFPVASNPGGSIGASYGIPLIPPQQGVTTVHGKPVNHGFFARTTFVIDADGRIVATLSTRNDGITPAEHVTKSLAIVQKMQAGRLSAIHPRERGPQE